MAIPILKRAKSFLFSASIIEARPLWQPLHATAAHQRCQSYRVEVADSLYQRALSLPSSVGLTSSDQARVIEVVVGAGASATR